MAGEIYEVEITSPVNESSVQRTFPTEIRVSRMGEEKIQVLITASKWPRPILDSDDDWDSTNANSPWKPCDPKEIGPIDRFGCELTVDSDGRYTLLARASITNDGTVWKKPWEVSANVEITVPSQT
jgi:hypothetical protein